MATSPTGAAERSTGPSTPRPLPGRRQFGEDLWGIPVPIPDNPLGHTWCYVLGDDRGPVVVDPGWGSDVSWQALTAGLAALGWGVADVQGVAVTHIHPDHHGLSARLREASGAWVAMHEGEVAELDALPNDLGAGDRDWLVRCGVPAEELDVIGVPVDRTATLEAMARPDRLLAHGDRLPGLTREIHAVHTPGHTMGHLCFTDTTGDLVLTGDHVLGRITPNLGMQRAGRERSVDRYLDSLRGLLAAPTAAQVLPGHEEPFLDLPRRSRELMDHTTSRSRAVLSAVTAQGGADTLEITRSLSWSRPWSQIGGLMRRAALGETLAHLLHLERAGLVRMEAVGQWDAWHAVDPPPSVQPIG